MKLETLEDINNLIKDKIQESINLDYKRKLGKNPDIAKDVSAFANTLGGIIIYGVVEKNNLPVSINWIKSKDGETIESIILSSIQPKLEGVEIKPFPNPNNSCEAIFVVRIPESLEAPHMANHRYHKRHNFQSAPMEDYEVKEVIFKRGLRKALDFEISKNLELADKIFAGINTYKNNYYPPEELKPILLIPLHTDAWKAMISSGLLSIFKEKVIELVNFYSLIHEINSLIEYQKSGVETAYIPTYGGSDPRAGTWIPRAIQDKVGALLLIFQQNKLWQKF